MDVQSTDFPILYHPTENAGSELKKLMVAIEEKYSLKFKNFWEFNEWSVSHIPEFWAEIWDFSGVVCSKKYENVVDLSIPIEENPKWFEGARLNFAENLLKYRDEEIAMILTGEQREPETVTFAEMYKEASLYAAAFRKFGLKKGDVVVCYMPNRKEPVFAMQAVTSIGAIWTGALPILGPQAVLNRLKQVNPKVMLTIDKFIHDGEEIVMHDKVKDITENLPSLEKIIVVSASKEFDSEKISQVKNSCFLDDFLKTGQNPDGTVPDMIFEQVSFSHPVFINYTSGTTGLPKPVVHGCGGLMSMARDFSVHTDTTRGSRWLVVSPVGWVTWNMLNTLHFLGFTLVVFEGVPYFRSPTFFWSLIDQFEISHAFLPTSIIDEFMKRGYLPTKDHHLSSLKMWLSGGSVNKPQVFDFVYNIIKKDVLFSPSYGSTELMGSLSVPETTLPVHRGELNAVCLGTDLKILNEKGEPVEGEIGEIVLEKPIPSLLTSLWGDPDGSVLRKTYFSKHKGRYSQGDCGMINPVTKGLVICCRSDETLKQRGYRFGSSEIYNVVDRFPEIRDSLCVSKYNKDMDESAVLFLKIREGFQFTEELVLRVRAAITRELTEGHVPDFILETNGIPVNMNGKKMEIVVKKILNNMPYNPDTVANLESLTNFVDRQELRII